MNQSVLVVSPFFYPEAISTGKYNTHMAEAMRDAGYEVDVLCSYPLYPKWEPDTTDATLEGVSIKRGGLRVLYPSAAVLRRFVLEMWFAWFVFSELKKNTKPYDHAVMIFPPNFAGLLSARILRKRGTNLVGIVHDLQGVLIKAEGGLFRKMVFGLVKTLESKALNSMDKLIYLSENMRKSAEAVYPGLNSNTDIAYPFVSVSKQSESQRDYFNNGKFNIVYSGALGEKQNPNGLLALFTALNKADDRIQCHIFSGGSVFEKLKVRAKGSGVEFRNLVPEADLISLLKSSSLQVVPQVLDTSDGAFPSKIPNIVALNTPLLCITPKAGELHRLLKDSDRAVLADHWDTDRIATDVRVLLNNGREAGGYESELLKKFSVNDLIEKITG